MKINLEEKYNKYFKFKIPNTDYNIILTKQLKEVL